MFDKLLVEAFNTYFSGNQMPELNRIKSEIELIGYTEFADLTWSEVQDYPAPEEQDRVFKNAIFVAIQDMRHDEDLNSFRLLLEALENWGSYWERSFDEFQQAGLLKLYSLLNEAFYYSRSEEEFEEFEPSASMEVLQRLQQFVDVHEFLFGALKKSSKTEAKFIWQCHCEKLERGGYRTELGFSRLSLVPDFGGYLFNKILFFAMSWYRHEWLFEEQIDQLTFNKSAQILFADEIREVKSDGELEHWAHGSHFSFSSLREALEEVVSLYSEQLANLDFEKSSQEVFLGFVADLPDEF